MELVDRVSAVAIVAFAVLSFAGCKQAPEAGNKIATPRSSFDRFHEKFPQRLQQISESDLAGMTIVAPCSTNAELVRTQAQSEKSTLGSDADFRLTRGEVDDVLLKNGKAKLVAITYSFAPGDPSVRATATRWSLVRADCRTLDAGYLSSN